VIEALEHFDDEGSGSIASESLKPLLQRLLVPVGREQLAYLQAKLDPDRSGDPAEPPRPRLRPRPPC
jgi:hypothetical protein